VGANGVFENEVFKTEASMAGTSKKHKRVAKKKTTKEGVGKGCVAEKAPGKKMKLVAGGCHILSRSQDSTMRALASVQAKEKEEHKARFTGRRGENGDMRRRSG